MKLGKVFWITGSLLVNVTIGVFIYFSSNAPLGELENHNYRNDNWDAYALHTKAEFIFMTMMVIGALYFAFNLKKLSWTIISVGLLVTLSTYPIMLGGYRNTSFELSQMASQMSTVTFVFGNLIFLGGLLKLYLSDTYLKKWLKWTAVVLSVMAFSTFLVAYFEVVDMKMAFVAWPLINILYLINAYYGLKIKMD